MGPCNGHDLKSGSWNVLRFFYSKKLALDASGIGEGGYDLSNPFLLVNMYRVKLCLNFRFSFHEKISLSIGIMDWLLAIC